MTESVLGRQITPAGGATLCTPEMTERIAEVVSKGIHPGTAATSCGIGLRTWREWVAKAREGQEPYLSCMERVEQARASAIVTWVPRLLEASQQDSRSWPAIARWLESFDRDNWLRESKVITEGGDDQSKRPLVIQLVQKDRPAELPEPIKALEFTPEPQRNELA